MSLRVLLVAAMLGLFSGLSALADAPSGVPLVLIHDGEHWGGGEVDCPAGQTPVYHATRIECGAVLHLCFAMFE